MFGVLSDLVGEKLQQRLPLGSIALRCIKRRQINKTNPTAKDTR
jgi:hypothetical protein